MLPSEFDLIYVINTRRENIGQEEIDAVGARAVDGCAMKPGASSWPKRALSG
jgi:hypothetical protein